MLILTRRSDQSILLLPGADLDPASVTLGQMFSGQRVVVTVLGVVGRQVRIGIDAPPSITVLREELYPHPLNRPRTGGHDDHNRPAGFLVLTRRPDESLHLWPAPGSENIPVTTLFTAGPLQVRVLNVDWSVRLGIQAPRAINVLRDNAYRRDVLYRPLAAGRGTDR